MSARPNLDDTRYGTSIRAVLLGDLPTVTTTACSPAAAPVEIRTQYSGPALRIAQRQRSIDPEGTRRESLGRLAARALFMSARPNLGHNRYWTSIRAVLLGDPPTVTTTACSPAATPVGIRKLICVTPTSPLGIPTNSPSRGSPPTVTDTALRGFGRFAIAVRDDGVAPVARLGLTCPSPVRNSVAT